MSEFETSGEAPPVTPSHPEYVSGSHEQPASQDRGSFYEQVPETDSERQSTFPGHGPDVSGEQNPAHALEGDPSQSQEGQPEGYIKLPGEEANEDEIDAFYAALGVPETPDGYDLVIPEEMGEDQTGGNWKEYTAAISELSHALGLSPSQAQALAELDLQAKTQSNEMLEQQQQHYLQQQIEDTTATLREEWGPNMDTNVRTANRALKAFGGSELEGVLSEAGVLNDPVVLRAFHKAGLSLVEDSSPGGAGASRRNRSAAEILYPSSTKEG